MTIHFFRPARALVLLGALLTGLAACDSGTAPTEPAAETPPEAAPLTEVSFATDWIAQAEHGGFYMARALGLYQAAGLDVTIRPGGPGSNLPQLLAAGSIDLIMGSNSFIPLNMLEAGVPAKAVMAVFQKDPQVLITHPRDDVASIADMQGKPIMIADATRTAWWPWLEATFGFTQDQIRKYSGSVAPFLVDPTSIQQGYITSEPYLIAKELGQEPEVYLLADAGYPSYATMVMALNSTLAERPEMVRAFVAASIEGWERYLSEDPAPAHALIKQDNPDMPDDVLEQAREKLIRFQIVSGDGGPVGTMTEARWQTFFDQMSGLGLFEADLNYREAFTLDFLPQASDETGNGTDNQADPTAP